MGIPAHTSEVGLHVKRESRFERYYGAYHYPEYSPSEGTAAGHLVPTALSYKPPTVKGDHVHGLNYQRKVCRVDEDIPAIYRVKNFGSGVLVYDYRNEHLISVRHGPFGYQPTHPLASSFENESVVRALNRLAARHADLGTELAQLRQTTDLFAATSGRVVQAFNSLRRRNLTGFLSALGVGKRGGKSVNNNAGNMWLEYSYGWKPLAGTLYDLSNATHDILERTFVLTGSDTKSGSHQHEFEHGGRGWTETVEQSFRTKLIGEVRNPMAATLNKYGLLNPAEIAWELVPWSFAIDWFMPVGQTLKALTASYGLIEHGGFTNSRRHYTLSAQQNITWDGYGGYESGGSYRESGFEMTRRCFSRFPIPGFFVSTQPFSTERVANALALFNQLHR